MDETAGICGHDNGDTMRKHSKNVKKRGLRNRAYRFCFAFFVMCASTSANCFLNLPRSMSDA
jgi:hypothetical protein